MMFNDHFKGQERDSLDDEESQSQCYTNTDYQPEPMDNMNDHNYEFLCDDELQQLKQQQVNVQTQKWQLISEKLSLHFAMNSVFSTLDSLNGFLNKQKSASDKLLYYCDESMKTKGSTFSMGSGGILSYQQELELANNGSYLRNQQKSQLGVRDLMLNVGQISKKVEKKVHLLVKNQCDLLLKFEKERERSEFLMRELQRKDTFRSKESGDIEHQQESYIEDLEVQLQETRAALLERKIKLTDKEEEIKSLKKQIENLSLNFMQLEDEKKEIDSLVIRVSQQLKGKEMSVSDYNYQLQQDKDHLAKQVDIMNKQVAEDKERRKALEMVETDLLHKLEKTQHESNELKTYCAELQEKLELKSEAIEKAHKVIQRLNEEMEKSASLIGKIEQDRECIRRENKEMNKKVIELNKQLQSNINHQYMSNAQMNSQLKTEVDELKEALRQYQQEFDSEKRQLVDTVRDLNEQKYEIQLEKEKAEQIIKKVSTQFEEDLSEKEKQILEKELKIKKYENEVKDLEEQYKGQLETREQSAQSNILYMQRRLKEVTADEHRQDSRQTTKQSKEKLPQTAFLLQVKKEFDQISDEFLEMRGLIKAECMDKQAISHKLKIFEEFKASFMDSLLLFESKAVELGGLSQKYEKQLDEQKKMFLMMRTLIKEKDQLIQAQHKQLLMRDQALRNNIGILGKEIDRSCKIMSGDMMGMIVSGDHFIRDLLDEKSDLQRRFEDFKGDYVQLLDDKDQTKNESLKLFGQIEMNKKEIKYMQEEFYKFKQSLCTIINIKQSKDVEVLREVEEIVDELRVRRDEVMSYKSQIQEYHSQAEQEKRFLQSRILAVESQLEVIQREGLNKEEEIQVSCLQKETRYINEVQRLQTECSAAQNEAQLREKQCKKLQDKVNSAMLKVDQLEGERGQLYRDKQELLERDERMGEELRGIQEMMEQTQSELDHRNQTMEDMHNQMKDQEEKQKALSLSIYEKEAEIQKERELNLQLQDEKFQGKNDLEKMRDTYRMIEKENQNLYSELRKYKDHISQLQNAIQTSEYEKEDLQRAYSQMSQVVEQAQKEIMTSHEAIDDLNMKAEENKHKDSYISSMREEVKSLVFQKSQLNMEVEMLKKLLNPEKASIEIQTRDSGMQEIMQMREDVGKCRKDAWNWSKESESLRDAIKRQNLEIDRLIDEKRELEDLVDQQNQSIKQIRINQSLKENVNPSCSLSQPQTANLTIQTSSLGSDLYNKILQEKENYIMRLEGEMGEMRKEIESLKHKILISEMNKAQIVFQSIDNGKQMSLNSHSKFSNRHGSVSKENEYVPKYR